MGEGSIEEKTPDRPALTMKRRLMIPRVGRAEDRDINRRNRYMEKFQGGFD